MASSSSVMAHGSSRIQVPAGQPHARLRRLEVVAKSVSSIILRRPPAVAGSAEGSRRRVECEGDVRGPTSRSASTAASSLSSVGEETLLHVLPTTLSASMMVASASSSRSPSKKTHASVRRLSASRPADRLGASRIAPVARVDDELAAEHIVNAVGDSELVVEPVEDTVRCAWWW